MRLEEKGTQDGGGYNQENTGEKPAGRGLRGVGVAAGKLAVGLDTADQTQYGTDGITEFRGGIEIGGHETGRLVDTCKALALRVSTGGYRHTQH